MPEFFKTIYETAMSFKPDALVEFCPCGTAYSFFTLPYLNMAVASDPESSWQIRTKGKTLKALMGDSVAYFGDHVELSDGHEDFASTVGVGGVVGTNFTWPGRRGQAQEGATHARARKDLEPLGRPLPRKDAFARASIWASSTTSDSTGPKPTRSAKTGSMYYAFYAPNWEGEVELRGLEPHAYQVSDYVHGVDLGTVTGPTAKLAVKFDGSLLLEAQPE